MQISVSRLRAYQSCPQKYQYRYVTDAEAEFTSANLFFGSALHHAISEYHQSQNTIDADEMYVEFLKYWQTSIEECQQKEQPIRYGADPQELQSKAYELCALYVSQFESVIADSPDNVELLFEVPLFDPQGGWGTLEHTLRGKIDLVANRSIYEFKTASRTPSQKEADTTIQLSAYAMAYQYIYDEPPENLYLVGLVKTKTPKIKVLQTIRWYKDYQDLVDMGMHIARAIEARVFYRNRETLYGCGGCEYQNTCLGFRPLPASVLAVGKKEVRKP